MGVIVRMFHLRVDVFPFWNISRALSISLSFPAVPLIRPESFDEHRGF